MKATGDDSLKIWKWTAVCALLFCLLWQPAARADLTRQETEKYGKVVEAVWVDETGAVCAGPEGYARVTYSYDGTETTERYYDAEGEPCQVAGGAFGLTVTRDGKRRVVGIVYLDEDGRKALNALGYARVKIDYTSFDEVKNLTFYGEGKGPVVVPSLGYASVKTEFRGKTMTRRTWMDDRGNPVDTPQGYAVLVQRINKKNQVLGVSFEHADGTPATCADGWSSSTRELDEEGREVCVKYYAADGSLTDRGAGYAWAQTEYVGRNERHITRYDLSGEKTEAPGGYTTLCQTWQEDRVVLETFLNAEGQRILNRDGGGAVRYDYDAAGRVVQVNYEDLGGSPCPCQAGYCGFRDTLDEAGRVVSRQYLGADGLPTNLPEGYSEVRTSYDAAGTVLSTRYFDENGIQVQTGPDA